MNGGDIRLYSNVIQLLSHQFGIFVEVTKEKKRKEIKEGRKMTVTSKKTASKDKRNLHCSIPTSIRKASRDH
jgi:hypothetical protein